MTRCRLNEDGVLEIYRSGLGASSGWHKQECPYCGDDCGVHCPLFGTPSYEPDEMVKRTLTICQGCVLEYEEMEG